MRWSVAISARTQPRQCAADHVSAINLRVGLVSANRGP
jgi:hypothetical protein